MENVQERDTEEQVSEPGSNALWAFCKLECSCTPGTHKPLWLRDMCVINVASHLLVRFVDKVQSLWR